MRFPERPKGSLPRPVGHPFNPRRRILTVARPSANLCFIETDGTPLGSHTSRSAHQNRPTNSRPPPTFCLNATSKCAAESRKPSRKLSKGLSLELCGALCGKMRELSILTLLRDNYKVKSEKLAGNPQGVPRFKCKVTNKVTPTYDFSLLECRNSNSAVTKSFV